MTTVQASSIQSRAAGILLHPTSLPSLHGIGDLGPGARLFVDWLQQAGMTRWQVLPLVPPGPGFSPYATLSGMACNPLLIDLNGLARWGLLDATELEAPRLPMDRIDVEGVRRFKLPLLERAADRFLGARPEVLPDGLQSAWQAFLDGADWLDDAALFLALRERHAELPWWDWPEALRDRQADALAAARVELAASFDRHRALQFFFDQQWRALRDYAEAREVRIVGDVPIYVDLDSADVWANRDAFLLDPSGRPATVAGVPPDFFSKTGQRWGNPLYDWHALKATGHAFWVRRMRRMFELVDTVRLDHFRGFSAFWAIPAEAEDARSGAWQPGPGRALFDDLEAQLGKLDLIAEDLGVIDAPVEQLRDALKLPGMRILQFAFGEDASHPFLPHNHRPRAVVYTGTHDNDTTLGWWQSTSEAVRDHVRRYFGVSGHDIVWDFIRATLASVAQLAVIPFQDILCLDGRARMNTPGTADGNWLWRARAEAFNQNLAQRLRGLAVLYRRVDAG